MKAELRRLLQAGAIVDKGTYWYRSPPPTVYRTTRDETLAIAVGYRTAPALGLLIALAVLVHEVPRGLTTTVIMQQAGYSGLRTWLALLVDAGFAPLGSFRAGLLVGQPAERRYPPADPEDAAPFPAARQTGL